MPNLCWLPRDGETGGMWTLKVPAPTTQSPGDCSLPGPGTQSWGSHLALGNRQEVEAAAPPWRSLTPSPGEAEAAAHPQGRVSSALCTCGSPWCRSRQRGLPRGRGAPSVSAPQSPSGSRTASSSWSTAPTGTTHSFHIVLAGSEGRGRERGGEGHTSSPDPEFSTGVSPTCSVPGGIFSAEGRETPQGRGCVCVCGVSFAARPPNPRLALPPTPPRLPLPWGPAPSARSSQQTHQDYCTPWCCWQPPSPRDRLDSRDRKSVV